MRLDFNFYEKEVIEKCEIKEYNHDISSRKRKIPYNYQQNNDDENPLNDSDHYILCNCRFTSS